MSTAVVAAAGRRTPSTVIGGLPCGRRVPRGQVRWYLIRVREGSEQSTCERLLRLVPRSVMRDCFVLRRESWRKNAGAWHLQVSVAYKGYVFAVTDDPASLYKALSQLSVSAQIAGADGRAWMPLSPDAQAWFERCADERHVLRSSVAVIEDDELHVIEGPLVGCEKSICDVDRHHRRCMVSVPGSNGSFTELMPLVVPVRN